MKFSIAAAALSILAIGCGHTPTPDVRSGDAYERFLGAIEIAQARDAAGYFALRKLLKDADPMARTGAVISIAWMNRQNCSEDLVPMLADPDSQVRLETCRWLGRVGGSDVVGPLLKALASDTKLEVRRTAALSLARFAENEQVILGLGAALGDPAAPVAYNAYTILRKALDRSDVPRRRSEFDQWYKENKPGGS